VSGVLERESPPLCIACSASGCLRARRGRALPAATGRHHIFRRISTNNPPAYTISINDPVSGDEKAAYCVLDTLDFECMANDIAKLLDVQLEYTESTYGNSILYLQSNKIYLGFALNPTPQRALVVDFTVPVFLHPFGAMLKKGLEAKTWADKGMTPFTPAVSVAFALQEGVRMLEEEGLDKVYERHARLARATQAGLEALGFRLFARDGYRSNTVTSAVPPPGLDVAALRRVLDTKYGVVIAGGQGKMTGKMVRVGHLGAIAEGDVVQVLWALELALEELDVAPASGRGVAAVTASLQGVAATSR